MGTPKKLVACLLGGLALIAGPGCHAGPATTTTNIVLISIDSLRADHIGAYGYSRPTTPTIDRLAAQGVVFTRAYSSSSWTLPAHAALLTGLADSAHGATSPKKILRRSATTLAEVLHKAGYTTTGFYSGPFLHPHFGLDRGFDRYIDCSSYGLGSPEADPTRAHAASHADVTNPNILRNVAAEISQQTGRPFFFFIHMWDVHYDLIPPPPFDKMFDGDYRGSFAAGHFRHEEGFRKGMDAADYAHVLALYDGEIRSTDETIGKIIAKLDELSLLENTLVVITSDHGEEFLEHEGKGHRQSLFEEVTRIPLVMWMPKRLAVGRVDDAVAIIDIAPTILDIVGLEPLPAAMGRSLLGLARGDRDTEPYPVLSQLFAPPRNPALAALVLGSDKLVVDHHRGTASYYNLAADPHELHPRPAHSLPRARHLVAVLRSMEARARTLALEGKSSDEVSQVVPPKPLSDRLRALGYLE